jgi:hypothetical protein
MQGSLFEREQTLTAVAVPGGDIWNPNDPKTNDLCRLLDCLIEKGVVSRDLQKRLSDLGIDLPLLLKCLGKECRSLSEEVEPRRL